MDEFEIFRARSYGSSHLTEQLPVQEAGNCGRDGGIGEGEWEGEGEGKGLRVRREGRRRSCRQRDKETSGGERGGGEGGGEGEGRNGWEEGREGHESDGTIGSTSRRRKERLNSQVTVEIEPPSPTDPAGPCRSHSWRVRPPSDENTPHSQHAPPSSAQLHRTSTMPVKRSTRSTRSRTPEPGSTLLAEQDRRSVKEEKEEGEYGGERVVDVDNNNLLAPVGLGGDCRIYRRRSFSTKKGGSIVNRGDSIKVCSRRGSAMIDPAALTALEGGGGGVGGVLLDISRRNSASFYASPHTSSTPSPSGGLLAIQDPQNIRRRSTTCVNTSPSPSLSSAASLRPTFSSNLHPDEEDHTMSSSRRRGSSVTALTISGGENGETMPSACFPPSPSGRGDRRVDCANDVIDDTMTSSCKSSAWFNNGITSNLTATTATDNITASGADSAYGCTGGEDGVGEEGEGAEQGEEGEEEDHAIYRVVVLGSHGVGKTTLTQQLMTSEYLANQDTEQTGLEEGDQIVSVEIDDEESMIQLIDASDEVLGNGGVKDMDDVDGYIVVYSVTDRTSFTDAQNTLQEITSLIKMRRQQKQQRQQHRGEAAVLLVANKYELVRNRVVTQAEGKRLASKRHCKLLEVSALLDHKVDEVLVTVLRQIRSKQPGQQGRPKTTRDLGQTWGSRKGRDGRGEEEEGEDEEEDRGVDNSCLHYKSAFGILRKLFK